MPARPRIVVIGSLNTDLVLPVARLPTPGETLAGGDLSVVPGGKGANQAVAAARLGADVAMVGRVGDDAFGRQLRDGLAAERIDVRHVRRTPGPGGTAVILLQPGGENSIVLSSGANARVTSADVDAAAGLIRRADAVLLQLEIPLPAVRHAMKLAKAAGVPTILDPAPVPAGLAPRWLLSADVLCPNETEAAALSGRPPTAVPATPDGTAAALVAVTRTDVVLKRGRHGALHADPSGVFTQSPAFIINVVDTTAAGDAFTAALAVGRAEGRSWADALRFANAAGALACTRLGAWPSLPRRRDVLALMRRS